LSTPQATREAFLGAHSGLCRNTLRACARQLNALRAQKAASLRVLQAETLSAVKKLWDETLVGNKERREALPSAFAHASTSADGDDDDVDNGDGSVEGDGEGEGDGAGVAVVTDATLDAHEAELARLQRRLLTTRPLLKLVRRRDEIVTQRCEFALSATDPLRFRIPGRLLAEEKLRRVVAKTLPRLKATLTADIAAWETTNGAFVVNGRRYLDVMRDTDDADATDAHVDADAENNGSSDSAVAMGPPAARRSAKSSSATRTTPARSLKKTATKTKAKKSSKLSKTPSSKLKASSLKKTPMSSSRSVAKRPASAAASKRSTKTSSSSLLLATPRRVFGKLQNKQ
jgi:hypothetical protein